MPRAALLLRLPGWALRAAGGPRAAPRRGPGRPRAGIARGLAVAAADGGAGGPGGGRGEAAAAADGDDGDEETLAFPGAAGGAPIPLTRKLRVEVPEDRAAAPCFRQLDSIGQPLPGAEGQAVGEDLARRMHRAMVRLQTMDTIFYEAQHMGKISFYMTSFGEEASVIGSAAALADEDQVFAQYCEQGVLLWRGYTFREFANQCYGNNLDPCKGRQMPVHYGSKAHNFHVVSSPLATQLPQAVGAAYALKAGGAPGVAVCYFGEGAASEGDFHAALNFAATLAAPVLFICRNNGFAISTPASEQYRGDGIAGRGMAYGIPSIRVDGGDALAVYSATRAARDLILERRGPVLLEAMSYRVGHHSTSDDSSRYRTADEMKAWQARDPVVRFQMFLEAQGWWDEELEVKLRKEARAEVIEALDFAEEQDKPALDEMFRDVYHEMPPLLREQERAVLAHVERHPAERPPDVPLATSSP